MLPALLSCFHYIKQEVLLQFETVEAKTYDVLEEGKTLTHDKCFDQPHEDYFSDRMDATQRKMKRLEDNITKEHQMYKYFRTITL